MNRPSIRSRSKTKLRIGKISYVNALPFYHRLEKENDACYEFYESYPADINAALREGRIDLAPISSLEYLNHQEEYKLLPGLAIGSRDFSGSVLLLSREKIEGLNGAEIAVSKQSLSSAALLQILLKLKYKFSNTFVPFDGAPEDELARRPAVLVIGDSALFFRPKEFVYKYDLSELWWNWTGKPFCFAVWAARRDFTEAHPEEAAALAAALKKNLETNLMDLQTLLRDALQLTFLDEKFPKVFGYLFNLSYLLDGAMIEGLELFYRLAARLGISPRPEKLEFFEEL